MTSKGYDHKRPVHGRAGEYSTVAAVTATHPARLFVLCDAVTAGSGVAAEELHNFAQSDLTSEDVMLLDTGASLFIWLGTGCTENEKASGATVAAEYLREAGRDADTPVTTVRTSPVASARASDR